MRHRRGRQRAREPPWIDRCARPTYMEWISGAASRASDRSSGAPSRIHRTCCRRDCASGIVRCIRCERPHCRSHGLHHRETCPTPYRRRIRPICRLPFFFSPFSLFSLFSLFPLLDRVFPPFFCPCGGRLAEKRLKGFDRVVGIETKRGRKRRYPLCASTRGGPTGTERRTSPCFPPRSHVLFSRAGGHPEGTARLPSTALGHVCSVWSAAKETGNNRATHCDRYTSLFLPLAPLVGLLPPYVCRRFFFSCIMRKNGLPSSRRDQLSFFDSVETIRANSGLRHIASHTICASSTRPSHCKHDPHPSFFSLFMQTGASRFAPLPFFFPSVHDKNAIRICSDGGEHLIGRLRSASATVPISFALVFRLDTLPNGSSAESRFSFTTSFQFYTCKKKKGRWKQRRRDRRSVDPNSSRSLSRLGRVGDGEKEKMKKGKGKKKTCSASFLRLCRERAYERQSTLF